MKSKFPNSVYLYRVVPENGDPFYEIAENLDGIPEDCDGAQVGLYKLTGQRSLRVTRTLA